MSNRSIPAASFPLPHRTIIISLLIVLPLLAGMFWGCGASGDSDRVHVLQPVDDPLVLPYRFQLEYSRGGEEPTQIVPLDFDDDGRLESYQVQTGRHTVPGLSSVLLYDCLDCGSVIEQYNYDSTRITDTRACDLDADGFKEIIVLFVHRDTLFAEIIDPRKGRTFRTNVSTGTDLNGDGVWDAYGYIVGCEDFTGDGVPEILISIDVGYDLYTRELVCLDWTRSKRVWAYEVAGIITYGNILVTGDSDSRRKRVVFGVASKGNAARANGMDDLHSYLICLDEDGQLVWRRQTGDVFTNPVPVFVHYDQDSIREVLFSSSVTVDSTEDAGSVRSEHQWSLVVCDLDGRTVDSLPVPADDRIRDLKFFERGFDGQPSVVFNTSDDTLRVYDEQLEPQMVITYPSRVAIKGFYDFLGHSAEQVFLTTADGSLWLLDQELNPLAQVAGLINPGGSQVIPGDLVHNGAGLQVNAQGDRENYIFRVVPTPWYTIFYRHPLLATAAGVTPLLAILSVVGVAMVRGRRKNRIISRQKDELAQALDDLHTAQEKLLEAEKSQLTHDIAGGVAHEIRNALDPAVQCLDTLQSEPSKLDERFTAMLDLSRRSVSRAIRMTRMVKELSDLSGSVSSDIVAVRAVIDDILRRNQERIGVLNLDADIRIAEGMTIACPRDHADILFGNLIGNAIDAMADTDERKLVIDGSIAKDETVIRISDSGRGISPDDRGRIFNAFYSTKPSSGMGLGLTLCKRIAAIYGGSLALDPDAQRGAVFVVTLPAGNPEGTAQHG